MLNFSLVVAVVAAALAQTPSQQHIPSKIALDMNVECVSLLGENFYRTPAEGEALKKLEAALSDAQKHAEAQPDNPALHIALGQALGGLWRYHDAAQAYSKAIALDPGNAEAFARRGNVFILLRQFSQSANDYKHAVALAPESGQHQIGLGMALYLDRKFAEADEVFARALSSPLAEAEKPVAGFWKELTQRRLGGAPNPDAPVWPFMAEYAVGVEKLLAGDEAGALEVWRAIADDPKDWPWLTHIAAEAEIAAIEGSKKMKSAR